MGVLMWHPETGGTFEAVSEDAVAHYRQSGWLRADERDDYLAALASHPSQAPPDAASSRTPRPPTTAATDGS
jgi:hypothetical protein